MSRVLTFCPHPRLFLCQIQASCSMQNCRFRPAVIRAQLRNLVGLYFMPPLDSECLKKFFPKLEVFLWCRPNRCCQMSTSYSWELRPIRPLQLLPSRFASKNLLSLRKLSVAIETRCQTVLRLMEASLVTPMKIQPFCNLIGDA